MDKTKLAPILDIAHTIGADPTYVQGGGGNISLKLDDTTMLVKASGLCLRDLTAEYGLVAIDYAKLRQGFAALKPTTDLPALIAASDQLVASCTDTTATLRPSIETGFHALLGTVVFHTHAAYANLLTCSQEGRALVTTLFPEACYIPYNTPGIALTLAIQAALAERPDCTILFLENHGLIISGDDAATVATAHEYVNDTVRHHFQLTDTYPETSFTSRDEVHTATCETLCTHAADLRTFPDTILFPDQVVYGEKLSFNPATPAILTIDEVGGSVVCRGSAGFARAAFETLTAWHFLATTIPALGLTLRTLEAAEGVFITNLESEQYRKQII